MTTTCLCLRVGQESQQNTQSSLQFHFGDDLKLIQKKKKCAENHINIGTEVEITF